MLAISNSQTCTIETTKISNSLTRVNEYCYTIATALPLARR